MRYLYYQGKVLFGPLLFMPILVLGGSIVVLLLHNADAELRSGYVLYVVEVFLPPLAMLLLTNIVLKEKDGGTLELVVPRTSLSLLFAQRFSLILLCLSLLTLVFLFTLDRYYTPIEPARLLFVAAAPALVLSTLGALLAHLTRETNAGYVGAIAWWMMCLLNKELVMHPWGKYLFLFSRTFSSGNEVWVQNKIVLLLLSVFFLAGNYLFLRNTEHFVR